MLAVQTLSARKLSWWRGAHGLRRWVATAMLAIACVGPAAAVDESELLPVDQAFALSATATARGRIELTWRIADGYYLYRHRIVVQPVGSGLANSTPKFNPLQLPSGEQHTDEFFGKVETYRGRVTATLTGAAATGVDAVTLRVKYQGCADLGVCYPPQTRTLTVALPAEAAVEERPVAAEAAPTKGAQGDGSFAALGRALGGSGKTTPLLGNVPAGGTDASPLPPEQAFGFEAIALDGDTLLLRFTPARGYYLYRDRTALEFDGIAGIALQRPRWPRGVAHRDEFFGDVTVYFDQVEVEVPLQRTRADAVAGTLTATFQGCQTDGICYPPMTRSVRVVLPAGTVTPVAERIAGAGADPAGMATATAAPSPQPSPASGRGSQPSGSGSQPSGSGSQPNGSGSQPSGSGSQNGTAAAGGVDAGAASRGAQDNVAAAVSLDEQAEDSRLAAALAGTSRWWTLLGFFGAGLLLAFTPCVLPMIPILSGLIAGQGTRIGTRRALLLSLVYVVANALVFTVAGVVAGLLGANLQAAFQTPWVLVAFAGLFVALALSSFGWYEMQLPIALRARLGAISERQHGGSLLGVAAMGALSALIVGPCVAPPLAAAVLYIGQSHDPVFGGAALFLLAMGMGLPLLAFGAAAGRGMPTSGPWMTAAQRVFGFVFLGLAIWMLSRILPAAATLALWGLLALAAAVWAFAASGPTTPQRARALARFAGLVLAVIGVAELLGALGGGRDPLQPLAGVLGSEQARELPFRRIKSLDDLDREVAAAQAAGKPLLFDFYADWCVSCKEMDKYTFTEPAVQAALDGFVLLKADVTANDAVDQALMQRFKIIGPPATLFFADGVERRELRLIGFEQAAPFVARVQRAAGP